MKVESLKKMSFSEIEATLGILGKYGVTTEGMKGLRSDPGLAMRVAVLIMSSLRTIYRITVDYSLSLAEMIELGKYEWADPEIVSRLKHQGSGKQGFDLVLVTVTEILAWLIEQGQATEEQIAETWVGTKQVIDYLASQGLSVALIEHLLSFGATNQELQRQFKIIALGSSVFSAYRGRCFPSICSKGSKRELRFDENYLTWIGSYRFLAVRKAA